MRYTSSHDASVQASLNRSEDDTFAFPASFAQRRLWFLDQWEPGVYIIPLAVGMEGTPDVGVMEQALKDMIQRHEALRTTFRMTDNALVQVVAPHVDFSMPLLELQHFPADVRRIKLRRLIKEEFRKPFDLERGPLIRASLVKLQEDYHAFLLSMHHIISDAWSMEVFFREWTNTYTAYVQGEALVLPRLDLQYVDYTVWQQEWLQGEVLEQHLAYWREQLQDAPLLQLPFVRSRPGVQTFRARARIIVLPAPLSEALKALCRREGMTLFMGLLAAFKTLLYRYTQQEKIVVGIPIAGRTENRLEGVLGCFINTLALCTDVSGNPPFRELLKRVREVTLGAYAHQDMPFEKLVEVLQPERDLSRNPLTQVMFALQNVPKKQLHMAGLRLVPIKLDSETSMIISGDSMRLGEEQTAQSDNEPAMFDLDLTMWERGSELVGELKYNVDLFDADTMERLQAHFLRLLEAIVADPGQPINDLPLLSDHERFQQLVTWNRVEVPYGLEQGYAERFAEQARRTPEALAVSCGKEQLTYRQLDRRANALAQRLREEGIGPEKLVAVLDQREVPWAIALLAIWKAGGAYLPLDPAQPVSRLRQMIRQSDCSLLLVGPAFAARLQSVLDEFPAEQRPAWQELRELEEEAEQGPELCWQGRQLAYVIYTSGSTGQPKGAMVEQAGMLNHVLAKVAELELHAGDCVAQTASQCFDISLWQLLAVWLVGGRVCIFSQEQAHDPQRLLAEVQRVEVTILEIVPSLLRALLDLLERGTDRVASSLRWLLLTGEGLPVELCQRWFALSPGISLLNAYGPTECSDDVTHQQIRQASELAGPLAPLGYPLPNTRLYILDAAGQPVPVGVSGELWIGGKGVGRGYVGDGRRTAEVFRPDPFGEGGQRLYRSGDLARYRAEGQIEFLGRMDQQVKLRGYRIELGEIEAVLRKHEAVRDCVVVVRAEGEADPRLLAYVVPREEATITTAELLTHLKEFLPEYMVPAGYAWLDSIPLTANGKLDRKALPESEYLLVQEHAPYVAPSTPTEQALTEIWSSVLGHERIGIHDDFFLLGGHSLLAIRLMSQIEQRFERHFPLETIFQWRTIAELASVLDRVTAHPSLSSSAIGSWEAINLHTEATLELTDCPEVWPHDLATDPATILLTGATSFLGTFLLAELLRQTSANIYCLLSCENEDTGRQTLRQALIEAFSWDDVFGERLIPLVGDLAQPLLGLSEETFTTLSQQVDVIYHAGAAEDRFRSYQDLKAINVEGTRALIRLASNGKIKPFHYVSTLSIFTHKGPEPVITIDEREGIDDYAEYLNGGYDKSKWVTEKLVQIARSRGLPCVIYRPGRITGHSQNGFWHSDDLLSRMVRGCIQLESWPVLPWDEAIEMTPVDYVSRAIVALSRRKASYGQAFHLFNPSPIKASDIVAWTNALGFVMRETPYLEWRARLDALLEAGEEHTLTPIAPLLFPAWESVEVVQPPATQVLFEDKYTRAALRSRQITCPVGDETLYATYLNYMVKSGLLTNDRRVTL